MTKMNIKTGDTVKVIAGKDKGAQGEVLFAFPEKGRVTVQGVNLVHKALRPTQANPNGGIDTREAASRSTRTARFASARSAARLSTNAACNLGVCRGAHVLSCTLRPSARANLTHCVSR